MTDIVKNYSDIQEGVEKSLLERNSIINRRGNVVIPRKYHMTESQLKNGHERWSSLISNVSSSIKDKVSSSWFNPYRENGGYFGGVQALFLLGANEWHSYGDVRVKMQEDMSLRHSTSKKHNSWDSFSQRGAREGAASTKDLMGRIVQNFRTLQRLGGVHPYGFQLKQLLSSIDIRRTSTGIYEFRLNTEWSDIDSVSPHYDISSYDNGIKRGHPKSINIDGVTVKADIDITVSS
jgi:hypothetical protein